MSSLPPLKRAPIHRPILKNTPWYIRHKNLTVIGATVLGVGIVFSRFIYDAFAEVPYEVSIDPALSAQRLKERNLAIDSIHKALGADPKVVEEYRAKLREEDKKIRAEREKIRQKAEELRKARLAASE